MFSLVPNNRRGCQPARRDDFMEVGNIFNSFLNDSFFPVFSSAHAIRADIREKEKEYVVEAEIPGVKKEDIKLDLRDDVLTIAVEHNEETNEERNSYIRKERRYGSYSRSFYVENVSNETVKAKYVDGILTINLPKEENVTEKRHNIEIQ